jgi:hypothetical protein
MAHIKLWHVTHKDKIQSIVKFGLDPAYSHGPLERVWLCDTSNVTFMKRVVANDHGWKSEELALVSVSIEESKCKCLMPGVYYTRCRVVVRPKRKGK